MLYIGSDHGGFQRKMDIIHLLKEMEIPYEDVGSFSYDPGDDYPDFAVKVAKAVAQMPNENRGIVFCRSGVGVDIVANKFPGVKSALVASVEMARFARLHDNSNVLAIAADYLTETETFRVVKTWLTTPFSGEERHVRRLAKIAEIEKSLHHFL